MQLVKYVSIVSLALLCSLLAVGCGSSSTNNQGVSFTLLGFFAELPEAGSEELPQGSIGQAVPISAVNPETQAGNAVGTTTTIVGLKNNIVSQFIRTDRLKISYYIEGASKQPPNTTIAFSVLLGPGGGSSSGEEGGEESSSSSSTSSLPDFSSIASQGFGSFPIITPDISAWLNLNRGSLPELPFTLTATVKASGVTSSGNRVDSNEAQYFIIFTPDNEIAPTNGSSGSGDDVGGDEGGDA